MSVFTASAVVETYVSAASTLDALNAATVADVDAFAHSAIVTYRAMQAGVTAKDLAEACKSAVVATPGLKGRLYTSQPRIAALGRTGHALSLDGTDEQGKPNPSSLPETVGPRDVLTMIADKGLSTGAVDAILNGTATSTGAAYAELKAAAVALAAAKRKALKVTKDENVDNDSDSESGAASVVGAILAPPVPVTALSLLTAAYDMVEQAIAMGADAWDEDAYAVSETITAVLAGESVTVAA